MSDGIFIQGKRPASKKAVKDAVKAGLSVSIESTSMFGGYDGPVENMPEGKRIDFVGPDPYTKRNFYGSITRTAAGIKVV